MWLGPTNALAVAVSRRHGQCAAAPNRFPYESSVIRVRSSPRISVGCGIRAPAGAIVIRLAAPVGSACAPRPGAVPGRPPAGGIGREQGALELTGADRCRGGQARRILAGAPGRDGLTRLDPPSTPKAPAPACRTGPSSCLPVDLCEYPLPMRRAAVGQPW